MSSDLYHLGNRDAVIWLFRLVNEHGESSALKIAARYLQTNHPEAPIKEALDYLTKSQ